MKLFFEICKEFFDLLYLPFVSDIIENEIIREDLDNEELDQEKGYKEEKENLDYEYIENDQQENHQFIPDIQYNHRHHKENKDIEENKHTEENKDIEEKEYDEDFCGYEFFRQIISFIHAQIYKQLNDKRE